MSTYDQTSKNAAAPPASAFNAQMASTGKFACSMDGYKKMTKEILELVLVIATFANETFKAMLPLNL